MNWKGSEIRENFVSILAPFFLPASSGGSAVITEILFAPIPKPDPQHLGDLFLLLFGEPFVKFEGAIPLHATGAVLVGVPIGSGEPNATVRLLDQGCAGELFVRDLFLFAHVIVVKTPVVVREGM